uniref:Uncharacterized protein n=1 Tax=Arundo donax TaxID=35708 RepID=A0A0A8Y2B9_ARUDO
MQILPSKLKCLQYILVSILFLFCRAEMSDSYQIMKA